MPVVSHLVHRYPTTVPTAAPNAVNVHERRSPLRRHIAHSHTPAIAAAVNGVITRAVAASAASPPTAATRPQLAGRRHGNTNSIAACSIMASESVNPPTAQWAIVVDEAASEVASAAGHGPAWMRASR